MQFYCNFNGTIQPLNQLSIPISHTALSNGEVVIEKFRLLDGEILFFEEHYFHLMANMRKARMPIPMEFVPEFIEEQVRNLAQQLIFQNGTLLFYAAENKGKIDFWIRVEDTSTEFLSTTACTIDLYKEPIWGRGFFNQISFPAPYTRILNAFCQENDLDDLLLVNEKKAVARTLKGNLFVLKDDRLKTPRLEDGAIDGVFRSRMIEAAKKTPELEAVEETEMFAFAVNQADAVFVLKEGENIQLISNFRKKSYTDLFSETSLIEYFLK